MSPVGYTQFWSFAPESPEFKAAFGRMVVDAKKILDAVQARGIALGDGTGEPGTKPELNERYITFNGVGDEACETFEIDSLPPTPPTDPEDRWSAHAYEQYRNQGYVWTFCKTQARPYDLAVTAVLLRCYQLCPDAFVLSSDGDWTSDWVPARDLVIELFGKLYARDPLSNDSTLGPPVCQR